MWQLANCTLAACTTWALSPQPQLEQVHLQLLPAILALTVCHVPSSARAFPPTLEQSVHCSSVVPARVSNIWLNASSATSLRIQWSRPDNSSCLYFYDTCLYQNGSTSCTNTNQTLLIKEDGMSVLVFLIIMNHFSELTYASTSCEIRVRIEILIDVDN